MASHAFRWTAGVAFVLTATGVWVQPGRATRQAAQASPADVLASEGYVGASACARCHERMHRTWHGARHSKMLQPASADTVVAPFSGAPVVLRGSSFVPARDGERFTIRGAFPTGEDQSHRVDYTLGSRRVQHYLTTLPDGRIVVLPPTWDVERGEWFHNLDIVNPNQPSGVPVQVWNRDCFGCHVSGEIKHYDAARDSYATRWTDFGTSCERCHGPGRAHVNRMAAPLPRPSDPAIVVPTDLAPERSSMICAQCHSFRDLTVPGFAAGGDYFDHFTPVLEYADSKQQDPVYWADGRPRRFSNDAVGLWQSRCFLEGGATCTTCHLDPHEPNIERNPQLARSNNALCLRCHETVGADVPAHTRHAPDGPAGACVACHMPSTVVSLRSRMPDHTISVPAPENTVRHGIPNACTECHANRDAAWAVEVLAGWYPGGRRRQLVRRADAFTKARRRDPSVVEALVGLARDDGEPPLVRANAVGYLRFFEDPRSDRALVDAASDEHPAVRVVAVLGLGQRPRADERARHAVVAALEDPSRIVRVSAMVALTNLQVTDLPPRPAALLEAARRDYLARTALLSDDAGVLLDAGRLHLLQRDAVAAAGALEASLRIDPGLHAARYFLGLARLAQGRLLDAQAELQRVPPESEHAAAAAQLLAAIRKR